MINRVCLISNPRTGSNRVCEIVGSMPSVCMRYEIFHSENAWGVSAEDIEYINLHNSTAFEIQNHSNQAQFTDYRRTCPAEFLNLLSRHDQQAGSQYFFFKLFDHHLTFDRFLKLSKSGHIQFVFLTRGTIDMYISALKANEVNQFSRVDTTNIMPRVSVENFLSFQQEHVRWYSSAYVVARQVCDPIIVRYEDIFCEQTNEV